MRPVLVFSAVMFALAGLFGYHVIYKGHQATVSRLRALTVQEQQTQKLQADVAALYGRVERYRARLAPEPDPSWLANRVVALGEQAGLKFTTIDREAPQASAHYTRLAVTLQFQASYHQLGAFLDQLERAEHFFRVERMEMAKPQTDRELSSVLLVLSTFHLPRIQPATKKGA
ncbi:MAG: type 4a pilus biogenesis protein PilO [Candidatus Omnitrophica bacterium]|nr:type 4a pilus biogenesis protein PilO [Candidatus Omnitrophota bacterium]